MFDGYCMTVISFLSNINLWPQIRPKAKMRNDMKTIIAPFDNTFNREGRL